MVKQLKLGQLLEIVNNDYLAVLLLKWDTTTKNKQTLLKMYNEMNNVAEGFEKVLNHCKNSLMQLTDETDRESKTREVNVKIEKLISQTDQDIDVKDLRIPLEGLIESGLDAKGITALKYLGIVDLEETHTAEDYFTQFKEQIGE